MDTLGSSCRSALCSDKLLVLLSFHHPKFSPSQG